MYVTFKEAVIRTVHERIFNISDRAPRSEFNWFIVFQFLGSIIYGFVVGLLASVLGFSLEKTQKLLMLWSIFMAIPGITVTLRRLNDLNLSKWLYCVYLTPCVCWFLLKSTPCFLLSCVVCLCFTIILMCVGSKGPIDENAFNDDSNNDDENTDNALQEV